MSEELKEARKFADLIWRLTGTGSDDHGLIYDKWEASIVKAILSRDKLIEEAALRRARQPLIEALLHVLAVDHFTNLVSVWYGDKSTRTIIEEALRPAASTSSDSAGRMTGDDGQGMCQGDEPPATQTKEEDCLPYGKPSSGPGRSGT